VRIFWKYVSVNNLICLTLISYLTGFITI